VFYARREIYCGFCVCAGRSGALSGDFSADEENQPLEPPSETFRRVQNRCERCCAGGFRGDCVFVC